MSKGEAGLFVEYCAKDFLDGTQMLDPWEELAYRRICDMIYTTNDRLPDDDRMLAWATKTGRRWPAIKRALTTGERPKLIVVDGRITNLRCQIALDTATRKIAQKVVAGKTSAATGKSLENLKQHRTDVRYPVRDSVRSPVRQPFGEGAPDEESMTYGIDSAQNRASYLGVTPTPSRVDNPLETLDQPRTDVRHAARTAHRTNHLTNKNPSQREPTSPRPVRAREAPAGLAGSLADFEILEDWLADADAQREAAGLPAVNLRAEAAKVVAKWRSDPPRDPYAAWIGWALNARAERNNGAAPHGHDPPEPHRDKPTGPPPPITLTH